MLSDVGGHPTPVESLGTVAQCGVVPDMHGHAAGVAVSHDTGFEVPMRVRGHAAGVEADDVVVIGILDAGGARQMCITRCARSRSSA